MYIIINQIVLHCTWTKMRIASICYLFYVNWCYMWICVGTFQRGKCTLSWRWEKTRRVGGLPVSAANDHVCDATQKPLHVKWVSLIDWLILYLRIPEKHGLSSWSPWSTYTTYRFRLVGHSYTFAWVIKIKEGKKIKEWGEKVMWK